jgi:hypothetical protein
MDEQKNLEKPQSSKVGYGSPPENTRFKKGQSGNPHGRPKGTHNVGTVLERTLRERVVINENGRRKTVTKLEAAFKQLANKAASGELKAVQLLTTLVSSAEDRALPTTVANPILAGPDEMVVREILKRWEATTKRDQKDEANGD